MNKYYLHAGTYRRSPMYKKGCLAEILEKYSLLFAERKNQFKIGAFDFDVRSHDTGISVDVKIVHPETNESMPIISATYWHYHRYTFNSSTFESGAWDAPLEKLIDKMALQIKEKEDEAKKLEQKYIQEKEQAEKEKKAKFEALFV